MDDSVFAIDALNLRLPQGFENHAEAIARQVGKELARLPIHHDVHVSTVQLPNLRMHGGESNGVIARRIAKAIHRQIYHAAVASIQGDSGARDDMNRSVLRNTYQTSSYSKRGLK